MRKSDLANLPLDVGNRHQCICCFSADESTNRTRSGFDTDIGEFCTRVVRWIIAQPLVRLPLSNAADSLRYRYGNPHSGTDPERETSQATCNCTTSRGRPNFPPLDFATGPPLLERFGTAANKPANTSSYQSCYDRNRHISVGIDVLQRVVRV